MAERKRDPIIGPSKENRQKGDWTDDSKKFWWGVKNGKWIEIDASTGKPYKKPEPKKRDRTKSGSFIKDPKSRAYMDKLLEKRWRGVPEI
jgi:hypothetical protein